MRNRSLTRGATAIQTAVRLALLAVAWRGAATFHQSRLDGALFEAIKRGDAAEVRLLLARGADARARDPASSL